MRVDCVVASCAVQRKKVVHPEWGEVEFDCQVLEVPGTVLRLVVYVPVPGSRTAAVFESMAAVAEERAG